MEHTGALVGVEDLVIGLEPSASGVAKSHRAVGDIDVSAGAGGFDHRDEEIAELEELGAPFSRSSVASMDSRLSVKLTKADSVAAMARSFSPSA